MHTLEEMGKEFIQLYKDALSKTIYDKEELQYYLDGLNRTEKEEKQEEINLEIFCHMTEEICLMGEEKFDNFISLLAIYYYCKCCYIKDENEDELEEDLDDEIYETEDELIDEELDEEDEIINDIESITKEEFIENIKEQNNNHLFDMLEVFFEEEFFGLSIEDFSFDEVDSSCLLDNIDEDEQIQKIFYKFHPNLKKELEQYIVSAKEEQFFNKCILIDVNSVSDFIQLFELIRRKVTDEEFINEFLRQFLIKTREKNIELCRNIIIFILKYYYIKSYFNDKENLNNVKRDIYSCIFEIDDINRNEYTITQFADFDLQKFCMLSSNMPNEVKEVLDKKISLNNLRTYGVNGIWKEYNSIEEINKNNETIKRFCPHWYFREDSEEYKYIIYFSIDENNEFNIPRLCIITDSDNNIIDIYGKQPRNSIELEMLTILEEKVKSFSDDESLLKDINILKTFARITNKIEKNEELTIEEIDFLYNITNKRNINNKIFTHYKYKLNDMIKEFDHKKLLSKYYDCTKEQIALDYKKLTEETVALASYLIAGTKCNYPNLKIILGNAFCSDLKSAEGLCSLERIKGDAYFEDLKDLKFLKNLIEVGGDLLLYNSENIDDLNPDLYVDGDIKLANQKIIKRGSNNI